MQSSTWEARRSDPSSRRSISRPVADCGNRRRWGRVMPAEVDMNEPKGRREFMQLAGLGGIVFASGLAGACTNILRKSGGQEDDFFFVQLSDSHWGFKGPPNPEAANTLRQAVAAVNALASAPDFVVFTGDLTHYYRRRGRAPQAHARIQGHRRRPQDAGAALHARRTRRLAGLGQGLSRELRPHTLFV